MEVMLRCEQVTWGESVRRFALTNSKSVPLFLPVTGGTGEPSNEDEEAGRAPAVAYCPLVSRTGTATQPGERTESKTSGAAANNVMLPE